MHRTPQEARKTAKQKTPPLGGTGFDRQLLALQEAVWYHNMYHGTSSYRLFCDNQRHRARSLCGFLCRRRLATRLEASPQALADELVGARRGEVGLDACLLQQFEAVKSSGCSRVAWWHSALSGAVAHGAAARHHARWSGSQQVLRCHDHRARARAALK